MNTVGLQELVGGALQEKFNKSFERVVDNLQDTNTPYKNKREICIKLKFTQNEMRDDVSCEVDVTEKLAPQAGMRTGFSIGKDLKTGEKFGWGRVLDYIGVEWEDRYIDWDSRQMNIFEMLGE